jgi:hypothetical protein
MTRLEDAGRGAWRNARGREPEGRGHDRQGLGARTSAGG